MLPAMWWSLPGVLVLAAQLLQFAQHRMEWRQSGALVVCGGALLVVGFLFSRSDVRFKPYKVALAIGAGLIPPGLWTLTNKMAYYWGGLLLGLAGLFLVAGVIFRAIRLPDTTVATGLIAGLGAVSIGTILILLDGIPASPSHLYLVATGPIGKVCVAAGIGIVLAAVGERLIRRRSSARP